MDPGIKHIKQWKKNTEHVLFQTTQVSKILISAMVENHCIKHEGLLTTFKNSILLYAFNEL